ncbi:MAG TPA: LysR family transcriptional regulator [Alphaproteobacteria bacterium]|jgi:DNA-binding transcriptional LysR family regulator|nr:LysR family transcriptional regulator [Alphaproteobacteria bacterium]
MDRLTSLEVFGQVVERGGFSAAGRHLNMSVTMVSNHIQALEDRLGVRLLNRTTRKVSLTDIGKDYYERSRQVLTDLVEADQIAGAQQATPQGQLRIYASAVMARFLNPVMGEYLALYPQVSIDLAAGDAMVDLIEQGYDLVIRTTPLQDSSLIVRRLASWRHILCCAPSYLEKRPAPATPEDLAGHNCIRYSFYPFGAEWRFEAPGGGIVSAPVKGNLLSNNAETLRAFALEGRGIFLAPSFLMADELACGQVVRLLPGYRPVEFVINAVYANRSHLPAKIRIFLDMLAERFAQYRKWLNPDEA